MAVELWKSDGTAAGTVLVDDIQPGSASPVHRLADQRQRHTVLHRHDGTHGGQLWKSDGTAAGTVLVKNINPNNSDVTDPSFLTNVNGTLFFSANDGTHGLNCGKAMARPQERSW